MDKMNEGRKLVLCKMQKKALETLMTKMDQGECITNQTESWINFHLRPLYPELADSLVALRTHKLNLQLHIRTLHQELAC